MLVFVLVFQMIAPGITVRAVQTTLALNLYAPRRGSSRFRTIRNPGRRNRMTLNFPCRTVLLLDVTVDAHGKMTDYQILSGPDNHELPAARSDAALLAL